MTISDHEINAIAAELRSRHATQSTLAQPSAPEGWVMVPVEPTPEMCDAGMTNGNGIGSMYRAMLAARPLPPAPTAEEV